MSQARLKEPDGLALAGGQHPLVKTQALADRHVNLPFAAVNAGQAQVGMKPERDRHRGVSRGPDGRGDRERRAPHLGLELQVVRERECVCQPVPELEGCGEHGAVGGGLVAPDAPSAGAGEQPVHRQAVAVNPQRRRHRVEDHVAAGEREPHPTEAVRPWVQQRDPHGHALGDVGFQAAADAE